MSYANSTLLSVLNKIETKQICLPSIQRKFEWGMDRIEMLFDSILNDYPIGTFLIWNVSRESAVKYKFFEVNNLFDLGEGKWQKPRTSESTHESLWALLDGQQRLTSISIGLQGSYSYVKNKRHFTKYLYYNLIGNAPSQDVQSFKFLEEKEALNDPNNVWIPVSMFVNTLHQFHNNLPLDLEHYKEIEDIFEKCIDVKSDFIKEFWNNWTVKNNYILAGRRISAFAEKIGKDTHQIFSYYQISNSVDLDICNEIFVRINSGGVKLSKADLLFSTVVSSWENGRTHVDNLIKILRDKGYDVDTEFIMRTCLYLVQSDILFKIKTFNGNTVDKIIQYFMNTEGEKSIFNATIQTFDFLKKKLNLSDKILKSKNVLIPVIHHVFHGGSLGNDSIGDVQKYIYLSLLQKVFGSHGDTLLHDLREGVTNADKSYKLSKKPFDFSVVISKIGEEAKQKLYHVDMKWAEKILKTEKGTDSWLVLSLIYGDLRYEYQSYDQDHLHPVSLFKKGKYPGDLEKGLSLVNTIPNLGFSTPEENRLNKNAHPLKKYVEEILKKERADWSDQYKVLNKIDPTVSLELEDFETFYEIRKKKLLDILKDKLNLEEDSSTDASTSIDEDYPDLEEKDDIETVADYLEIEHAIPIEEESIEDVERKSISETEGYSAEKNLLGKNLYSKLIEEQFRFLNGVYATDDIYNEVKNRYPALCDDEYLCIQNCKSGHNQPEWKHRVRSALFRLKEKEIIKYDSISKSYIID